jgi:hypothetical protein
MLYKPTLGIQLKNIQYRTMFTISNTIFHTKTIICKPILVNIITRSAGEGPIKKIIAEVVSQVKHIPPVTPPSTTLNYHYQKKGVPGSFTLSQKLLEQAIANNPGFNMHLLNYVKLFKNKLDITGNMNQQIYNNNADLLKSEAIWTHPLFMSYGNLNEKSYSLMFPFAQNFISHSFHNRHFDIKDMQLSNKIPIDFSDYKNTGITMHNMLEFQLFTKAIEPFYTYFIETHKKENIMLKAINPLITASHKNIDNNKIQTNNDFIGKIYYVENGIEKELVYDTKIIQNPEKNLPLLNGNISISYNNDKLLFLNRLNGALSNHKYNSNEAVFVKNFRDELNVIIKDIKKEIANKNIIKVNEHYVNARNLCFDMAINPSITTLFPSQIISADHNPLLLSDDQLLEIKKALETITIPQEYFPVMGAETKEYSRLIEHFIRKLPPDLRNEILDNYNLLIDYVCKNTIVA